MPHCSRCSRPRRSKHTRYCRQHANEYMRRWRAKQKALMATLKAVKAEDVGDYLRSRDWPQTATELAIQNESMAMLQEPKTVTRRVGPSNEFVDISYDSRGYVRSVKPTPNVSCATSPNVLKPVTQEELDAFIKSHKATVKRLDQRPFWTRQPSLVESAILAVLILLACLFIMGWLAPYLRDVPGNL